MDQHSPDGPSARVLVILPTYNEAATVRGVIERVLAAAPEAHVLVIDDASPDGTGIVVEQFSERNPRVRVLHRTGKLGLGTAYVAGFQVALDDGYAYAVEIDGDGSHLPEQLPDLLAAARAGAGLVLGTRWVPGGRIVGWPWYRRWISRTGTAVARIALRSRLHDLTSGFRVIERAWLERLPLADLESEGYGFQVEVAWTLERLGCPIAEVPITFVERAEGHSKMSVGIVAEALFGVLRWGWRLRFGRAARHPSTASGVDE